MFDFLGISKRKNKTKILIVDDETNIVQILKDRFESNQYSIITASNGKEGLEKAASERPDIILVDVIMPVMDGHEMLEALRRMPGCSETPVIMLTASSQPEDIERAKASGVIDYIVKPFSFSELLDKIECILGNRKRNTMAWRS